MMSFILLVQKGVKGQFNASLLGDPSKKWESDILPTFTQDVSASFLLMIQIVSYDEMKGYLIELSSLYPFLV